MQSILDWVQAQGVWAPVLFVFVYAGSAVGFVPGSLLTLSAGAIFGLVKGTLLVSLGSTLAAAISFLLGRFTLRGWIEKKLAHKPAFRAIDEAVGREGWKMVLLLRLSPVFPFALLNYGLGLTKIRHAGQPDSRRGRTKADQSDSLEQRPIHLPRPREYDQRSRVWGQRAASASRKALIRKSAE